MKKVNFKVVLAALSFAFIFLLGMGTAGAQTGASLTAGGTGVPTSKANSAIFSLPQGNFQSPQVALITLKNEMTNIKATLAQINNESDPTYIALVKLVTYYQRVYDRISSGQTVAQAIIGGLSYFNADANALTPGDLQILRNAGIALLD
ncbi:MAG: hypothetical protein IT258_06820 [Saprospiraceae bacterium]|nr:hypothetical protein [Saprospiraceae bacterium]